jgi:hypothetical protein
MPRVVIAVDPSSGLTAEELAEAWQEDDEAAAFGRPIVEGAPTTTYLPGVLELLVIPLAVNLASNVVYELVDRLVTRARVEPGSRLEVEVTVDGGHESDITVVVRSGPRR